MHSHERLLVFNVLDINKYERYYGPGRERAQQL